MKTSTMDIQSTAQNNIRWAVKVLSQDKYFKNAPIAKTLAKAWQVYSFLTNHSTLN